MITTVSVMVDVLVGMTDQTAMQEMRIEGADLRGTVADAQLVERELHALGQGQAAFFLRLDHADAAAATREHRGHIGAHGAAAHHHRVQAARLGGQGGGGLGGGRREGVHGGTV